MNGYNPIGNKPWTESQYRKERTMAKKKAEATKPAEYSYKNLNTGEIVRYPYVIADGCLFGLKLWYIRDRWQEAVDAKAPADAVRKSSDGTWIRIGDLSGQPHRVADLNALLENGVIEPPPEKPCKHCQEDTADGFHSCEGTEQDQKGGTPP